MQSLKFVSWNVRGFRSQVKRITIINHLKKLGTYIAFLQETHISNSDHGTLTLNNSYNVYSSTYNSKQRGVSLLINKKIPLTVNTFITDPDGRFIIINASI